MSWTSWLIIIELVGVITYFVYLARKKVLLQEEEIRILSGQNLPYKLNKFTLNDSEKEFFGILQNLEVIKNHYYIFPQLTLDKLVYIPKEITNQWIYLNEINRKFVDFTLFDKNTLMPQLVIELDGAPHVIDEKVMQRDKFVNSVLSSVGIKVLHIPRRDGKYIKEELNRKIKSVLS